jgi:hypothetical protein
MARSVFLVVYAVLWAAAAPTYSRLRAFAFADIHAAGNGRTKPWLRVALGFLLGNVAPAFTLAGILLLIPGDAGGLDGGRGWLILGFAALAGTAAAAFPRILHGILASNQSHAAFYTDPQWSEYKKAWDPALEETEEPGRHNDLFYFLAWGGFQLLVGFVAAAFTKI